MKTSLLEIVKNTNHEYTSKKISRKPMEFGHNILHHLDARREHFILLLSYFSEIALLYNTIATW